MSQLRDSLASASVERLTAERNPIAYRLVALADKLASTSRRLRVVAASAWIEWLASRARGTPFPDKPKCIVPTLVQLELSKWLVREFGEDQADQVIA